MLWILYESCITSLKQSSRIYELEKELLSLQTTQTNLSNRAHLADQSLLDSRALISEMTAAFAQLAQERSKSPASATQTRDLELENARLQLRNAKLQRRLGDRDAQIEELVDMIRFLQERNEVLLVEVEDHDLMDKTPFLAHTEPPQPHDVRFEVGSLAMDALRLDLTDSASHKDAMKSLDRLDHALALNQESLLKLSFASLSDSASLAVVLERHLIGLVTRQEQAQAQITTFADEIATLESKLSTATSFLSEQSHQADELRGRIQETEQRSRDAETCLAMERDEANRIRREVSGKDAKISKLTRELNATKDQECSLKTQVTRFVFEFWGRITLDLDDPYP